MIGIITKLLGSRIAIAVLAAVVAGGSGYLYFQGRSAGYTKGYDKAEEVYVQQIEDAISTTVSRRDEQWTQRMENLNARINATLEQNRATIAQERSLRERVEQLQSRLIDYTTDISDANLGQCNVTAEFDSLLSTYSEAPSGAGASDPTDGTE